MAGINTNLIALVTQRNLLRNQAELQTAMARLSSGLRINSAKDDAAGQAIANRMTAQINGLNQAMRNASDGISVAQTAEGALGAVNANLQRIRELSVQAANGTNSPADLASIQAEVQQRLAEIDRIGEQTRFNGIRVLGPQTRPLQIQVGARDGEQVGIALRETSVAALGLAGFTVDPGQNEPGTVTPLADLDRALNRVDRLRSNLGAVQNRFEETINNLGTTAINLAAARSRIQDADYAAEVANMVRAQILQQAGIAVLAQANQLPRLALQLLG